MAQRIVIDPVTRIEGHAKITLKMNDAGDIAEIFGAPFSGDTA